MFDKGWNFINRNGEIAFPKQWYKDASRFIEGYARVYLNGKGWNFINSNGEIAFPEQWYDDTWSFHDGYAGVRLDGKYYLLRKDGVLCDCRTKQPIIKANK